MAQPISSKFHGEEGSTEDDEMEMDDLELIAATTSNTGGHHHTVKVTKKPPKLWKDDFVFKDKKGKSEISYTR
jgi:hypothetical protein